MEAGRWCDGLPNVIERLCREWDTHLLRRGTPGQTSCLWFCMSRGRNSVLKMSPDAELGAQEKAALSAWRESGRVPWILEFDRESGALLMEEVRPGTPLRDMETEPDLEGLVDLVADLHASAEGVDTSGFPTLAERVEFIFSFWGSRLSAKRFEVSSELFEKSLSAARAIAARSGDRKLLHADLHPGNILYAGEERGFVAVDPRACVGDPTFDLIDITMFHVHDLREARRRVEWIADRADVEEDLLWQWCVCTVALTATARLASDGRTTPATTFLIEMAESEIG